MAIAERTQQILASIAPFWRGVREFWPLTADPEACDFLAGNPEVPALPGYVETVQKWLEPQHRRWFAYGPQDDKAAEAAASSLTRELGVAFEPEDVVLTRGAHSALTLAMSTVLDPGDEVVFVSPPWFFYEAMIVGAGGTPVRVRADERTWDLDVDAIASALTPRTRIVLINTPNNPTGRVYPEETLERLAAAIHKHEARAGRPVYILSDESYSRILYDGVPMRSPARSFDRTLVVHTFSKISLAPGQRLGYLAWSTRTPGREELREGAMSMALATGNTSPDSAMQYALPDLLGITVDMDRLQRRRDRMLAALRSAGYDVRTPEGTFYLLLRSPIEDDTAFVRILVKEKVVAMPGAMCEMPGYVRLSLTATDEMVERAIPVFERAIAANFG